MRQGARAVFAVVGLSAVLLGVGGCSGSGSPSTDPTTLHPGTAPPTTTATATPTQDPGAAAIAAVQRMFDAYNAMLKSGSSKAYRATFTRDCQECVGDAQTAEAVFEKHESIRGGRTTVTGLKPVEVLDSGKLVAIQGSVTQDVLEVIGNGRVVDRFDKVPSVPVVWSVSLTGGEWLVSRATVLR